MHLLRVLFTRMRMKSHVDSREIFELSRPRNFRVHMLPSNEDA